MLKGEPIALLGQPCLLQAGGRQSPGAMHQRQSISSVLLSTLNFVQLPPKLLLAGVATLPDGKIITVGGVLKAGVGGWGAVGKVRGHTRAAPQLLSRVVVVHRKTCSDITPGGPAMPTCSP